MLRSVFYAALLVFCITTNYVQAEEPSSVLTLEQAQSLALRENPELASFAIEIRAREAQALQAGLMPNPEINLTMENFGGSKELKGFQGAETTIELSQRIELGGKRAKRKNAVSLDHELARWDYDAKRADIIAEVTRSFIGVLAAQERVALKEELVRLSEQMYNVISLRASSGKISPVEETKAGVALASVRVDLEKSKRELEASRQKLAAFWGATPSFEKVEGKLDAFTPVSTYEELKKLIGQNPDIARWSKEMDQKNALLKLEEAKRIPDPAVGLGLRHLSDNNNNAFIFGVSIPLPLFNRNQGGVLEAQQRLAQTGKKQKSATVQVLTALAEAYQTLSGSYIEAAALGKNILPGALSAFEAAKEGYLQGKFNYLDVLDAQRTFFEAKNRYIEVLAAYHKALADVKRLTGEGVGTATETAKEKV